MENETDTQFATPLQNDKLTEFLYNVLAEQISYVRWP